MEQDEREENLKEQEEIREYLLGTLSDKATMRRIEEKILFDDDFVIKLADAEYELIDEHLDGTLDKAAQNRFYNFFLRTSERKEKLRLTQNLRRYAAQAAKQFSDAKKGFFDWLFLSPSMRFAVIALIVAGLGFGVWRVAFYQSEVDKGLTELRAAYRGQRPTESRLTVNFDYAPLRKTRGDAPSTGDEKARTRAEFLLLEAAKNPSNAEARHALGLLYLSETKFDRALEELYFAEKLAPGNAKLYSDIGAALFEKAVQAEDEGKFDEVAENLALSLKFINQALEIDDARLEALFNKALVLQKMKLTNQAREAWQKYLEKDAGLTWANEARRNLELLKQQSGSSKDKSQILQDYLDAFHKKDNARAWEIASQTKELVTGVMIQQQLAQKFLEANGQNRKDEADELLSAFLYLGSLERQNAGDAYFDDLAGYYSKTNEIQQQNLLQAYAGAQEGYESILKSNWQNALEAFERAKKDFSKAGNNWEAQIAEYQICYCLCQLNKIKESNERLFALSDFGGQKNYKWLQVLSDGWIGSNYDLLGEHSKAITYGQKSLSLAIDISDTYNIQKIFNQLTNEYWIIDDERQNLSSLYSSLNVKASYFRSPRQNRRNLVFAAESFYRFKFYDAAVAFAREEIDIIQNQQENVWASHTAHNHLALIYGKAQKYSDAFQEIDTSFQLAESFPNEATKQKQTAKTRLILAHLQRESGDCEKAIQNYNQVIQYYENTEFSVNNYEARKGRLLCRALQKNDSAIREEISELFKSFDNYRQNLKEEERNSFFNTEQDVYDLAVDYAFSDLKDFELSFNYTENSRARSLLNLMRNEAEDSQPFSLTDIRGQISPNVQMGYYVVLPDRILISYISDTKFVTVEKNIKRDEIENKVSDYKKNLIDKPDDENNRFLAKELYRLLVEPIETLLEKDKSFCVIPDKFLFQLPFASLVSPATNKYLIEDYALFYAPSATILIEQTKAAKQKSQISDETILSIGNPAFSRKEYSKLADLPAAAGEAEEIALLYNSPKIFTGKEAAKEQILNNIGDADVFHFAGHYMPNSKSPSSSKFLLAGSDLAVEEIMQKKLVRARLVILSACETGVETFYNGEGMIGAARAFLALDVPLVVASQWSVDSDATEPLMSKFHRYRKLQGMTTIAALRQAQIDMLTDKDSSFQQPFYWAGFLPVGGYADY